MQSTGFESDLFEEDMSSDAMTDVSEDGFEDGFEEAFGEDAFEEEDAADGFEADGFEGDGFEADAFEEDALEAADGFEEDGFETDAFGEHEELDAMADHADHAEDAVDGFDGFEDEGDAAIEQAFADAMDAEDEDEFIRRLWRGLRRAARVAAPALRRIGRRALPIGLRLLREGARRVGGVAGQELRGALGRDLQGILGGVTGGAGTADAMDALADFAADDDDVDAYVPVLGGMAGRYAVRNLTSPGTRGARPAQARAIGRAVTRATTQAARTLVRQQGPQAIRAIPQVVRRVTILIRRRGTGARAVPQLIRSTTARVAANPRVAARLSRPSPAARRLRARAGVRRATGMPGAPRRTPMTGPPTTRPGRRLRTRRRSIVIRGPARISIMPA
jgi:hypothetical protein